MKQVKIRLQTIPQVQSFINTVSRYTSEADLSSGKYVVDAKSIMGIFSLNLMQPVTLTVDGADENELVIAVAKGAHKVTGEYLSMRANAERMIAEEKVDKPMLMLIDPEYRDQKAIRIAISRLHEGRYRMQTPSEAAAETIED